MKRTTRLQRVLATVLGVGAAAILFTAGLPHDHSHAAASHPAQSCRVCRLQEHFAATPPASALVPRPLAFVVHASQTPQEAPRLLCVGRLALSRAPPASS